MSSVTLNLLKMQAVGSCRVIRPVKTCVSLNERNIYFVNPMKYVGYPENKFRLRILQPQRCGHDGGHACRVC